MNPNQKIPISYGGIILGIVKGDPFNDLRMMQEQMTRLLDTTRDKVSDDSLQEGLWQPAVDIYEDDQVVVVKMELPEVALEDIQVQVENHNLTIRGERRLEGEDKKQNYHRIERCYGPFRRTFLLPTTVDEERIRASCDQGVLKVILPKKKSSAPRQIEVEIK